MRVVTAGCDLVVSLYFPGLKPRENLDEVFAFRFNAGNVGKYVYRTIRFQMTKKAGCQIGSPLFSFRV
jgi:hypothetical protein